MPRKKKIIKKIDNLTQAKQIIKSKPWEFGLGLVGLVSVIGLSIFFSFVNYQKSKAPEFSYKTENKVILKLTPAPTNAPKDKTAKREHVLQVGESLWQVAEREYGSPYLYPTLIELNNLSSPDAIEPGMKIKVR